MIINEGPYRRRKLFVLDSEYPKDVSTTVISGNTKTVSFEAKIQTDGKPAEYTYQWYDSNGKIAGATERIHAPTVTTDTDLEVWCEVTNKAGTLTTRKASLKVEKYYLPALNGSYPADVKVKYASGGSTSATFSVTISTKGNPDSYTYQWYVDGSAVSGATKSSYTMSGLNAEKSYKVYCKVTNAAGSVNSREATLTVSPIFVKTWTGSSNMDFYYGDGSDQGSTTLVGSHYDYYETRYGQVLWFTTDKYGGTGFDFTWKPVAFTGDDRTVYCRISKTRADGCTNNSGNAILMSALSGGGYGCSDDSFVFEPNTTYFVYVNRSAYTYGYHHYASDNSGWGTTSITIR